MREAIVLLISKYGPSDSEVRKWILDLRTLLTKSGRAEEAAEVWQWWNLIAHPPSETQSMNLGSTDLNQVLDNCLLNETPVRSSWSTLQGH